MVNMKFRMCCNYFGPYYLVIDWPSSMGCSFQGRLKGDFVLFSGACSVFLSYAELG